jgi:hypothetical protein
MNDNLLQTQIFNDLVLSEFHNKKNFEIKNLIIEKYNFYSTGNLDIYNRFNSVLEISTTLKENLNSFRSFYPNLLGNYGHLKFSNISELISQYIASSKVKSAALLFSGGKDSTLLAKLLKDNGVKVNLYHVAPHNRVDLKDSEYLSKISKIAERINADNLNIYFGGLNSKKTFEAYGYNPFGITASSGLANIFTNSNIVQEESIWFSQGADTLSNVVHTQTQYSNDQSLATKLDIYFILQRMLCLTYPKKFRLFGVFIANQIWNKTHKDLEVLVAKPKAVVSIILGMFLVHTPTDSGFVYKISNLNGIPVFNPFHSLQIQSFFLRETKNRSTNVSKKNGKYIILNELSKMNLMDLSFLDSGFKIRQITNGKNLVTEQVYRKEIFSLYIENFN